MRPILSSFFFFLPGDRALRQSVCAYLQMKAVNEPVENGSKDDAGDHEKHNPRVKGVKCREELARGRSELVNRPHASEQHGWVDESIQPGNAFKAVVAQDADGQRTGHNSEGNREAANLPSKERSTGE
jgi:hypothetical protein